MPGAAEIHRTLRELEQLPEARAFQLHALHGELKPEVQDIAVLRIRHLKSHRLDKCCRNFPYNTGNRGRD